MSTIWNGGKNVVNNVVNWVGNKVNQVANWASNTWQGVQNWAGNALSGGNYRAPNTSYGGYGAGSGGYYPSASGLPSSYLFNNYAQKQAIQTAQRQQRISNAYAKATGNKGKPKTKEGKNIFRNFSDAVLKMLTNFCTSNDKSKDDAKNSRNTEKLAAIGKKQMEAYGIYEKPDGSGFTLDSGTVTENMVNNFVGGSVLSYAGIKSQQGAAGKTSSSSNKSNGASSKWKIKMAQSSGHQIMVLYLEQKK